MAAPYGIDEDFLLVDGLRTVGVRFYDPAADAHAPAADCRAVRWAGGVNWAGAEGGEVRAVATAYTLYAADLPARPPLRSLITDGPETWVVGAVAGQVFDTQYRCEVTRA